MDFKNLKESGKVEFKTATYPQLIPHSDIHEVDGKTILVFQISEYPVKPVACKNSYYKRVKNSNHLLSLEEIVDLRQQSLDISFDAHGVEESLSSLDTNAMEAFMKQVNSRGRITLTDDLLTNMAEAFYLTGDIEKYGTGFIRIRKKLNELKAGTFRISETGDFFRVELLDAGSVDLEKNVQTLGKTPGKTLGKTPGKTQAQILEILSKDPHRPILEIAGQIKRSESATQRALRKLREQGLIERVGSARAGYWKIITRLE